MSTEQTPATMPLTDEQDTQLGYLLNRALNVSSRLQYEPTPESFAKRFLEELDEDLASLKQVFPLGGKDYEENLAGSAIMWKRSLLMCPAKLTDTQVMYRTLKVLFDEGGHFAPYIELTTFRMDAKQGKLLAALYHLIMNEPEKYEPWLPKLTYPLSLIFMGAGEGLEVFIQDLEGLQNAFGGETHIDALPEIARVALQGMSDKPKVLRQIGGIPALERAGVDIYELLKELQEAIRINAHAQGLFDESYHLIVEAIEHLHQTKFFTDEQRDHQRRDLAMTCFDEIDSTENSKKMMEELFLRKFWATALAEIAPALPRENYSMRKVLYLLKYTTPDPQWLDEVKLADNFVPDYVKLEMKKAFPEEKLYDAVDKLRALHLYTDNERLQLLANRFSNDLGL